MISIESVVYTVVYLIVVGAIFYLLHWLIGYVGLQDPFAKFARVFLAVVAVLLLIGLLLGFVTGRPLFRAGNQPVIRPAVQLGVIHRG